jgi:hypothetical protein
MSEQNLELPAVARNINLPCKKCGVDRYFVVVAHLTPSSAKVKCEVCGANKTYKLPKVQVRKKVSFGKAAPKKVDAGQLWIDLKTQIGTDKVHPYNMKIKFAIAQVINHPKFGIGFITSATPEKVEVAFQDCGRSLVHNRP